MSSPLSMPGNAIQDPASLIAFISPSGGIGRTSAVANLAWILASARKRVLIVDWGTEAPWTHQYLEPFYVEELPIVDALGEDLAAAYAAVMPLGDHAPSSVVKRHDVPHAGGHIDVLGSPEGSAATVNAPLAEDHASGAVAELRERLRGAGYDYVLIDGPTDTSDTGVARIAVLCDTAVVCFTPRQRAIAEAVGLARRVRDRTLVGIEILPAPTQFDDRYRPRAEQTRSAIRAAFAEFRTESDGPEQPSSPDAVVEIPYEPYDVFDELLTVLLDEADQPTSLTTAYERLANAVTKGAVTALPPVPPVIRARYRRSLGLESAKEPDRIVIAYAARDRAWADWARSQLERAGAEVRTLRSGAAWVDAPEPPGLVVVSSPHLEGSRVSHDVAALLARVQGEGRTITVAELRVADGAPKGVGPTAKPINIVGRSEQQVRARLLTHFGMIDRPGTKRADGCRYPTGGTRVPNLPPKHPGFVGRDDEVEALRDQLLESNGRQPSTVLTGAAGIGKSELALEYAYRFAYDYDLVWWVPAHDRQSILASLSALAEELRPGRTGDAVAALEVLSSGASGRWLLVYDNADDPAVLEGLLPVGRHGHVLITSPSAALTDRSPTIELDVFLSADSARMLCDGAPDLFTDDAQRVALAVDHLPLALHLAVAWLRETISSQRASGATVAEATRWAAREFLSRLEDDGSGGQLRGTAAQVIGVVTDTLRETPPGRAAILLAQMCAFLSPQGVDLRLLRSRAMLAQLISAGGADTEALTRDASEADRVLWTGSRFGLFDVDWGRSRFFRVHRVVQTALREAMTPDERRARRAQVLAGLAAYAPTEVEDEISEWGPRFAELQKHLVSSGAVDSDDEGVRRWVVSQVRYLYLGGDAEVWEDAINLAHGVFDRWTSTFGASDKLRLRLAGQLANLHRALGHNQEALWLDDAAVAGQRRSLPLTHPQALISARGRGADLRGLGRFAEAFEEDQATWEGLREALGDDHPHTRRAANNLALSLFLSGDVRGALTLERDNYHRRMRLFGPRHPDTWWSLCNIGAYLRELGRYDEALDALRNALEHTHQLRPLNHPDELRIQRNLAITERRLGRAPSAKERNGRVLRAYRETFGTNHPDTLACALSLAADHHAVGDARTAVDLATACLQGYEHELRLGSDHPFIALCQVALGLHRWACGDVDEAGLKSEAGWAALRRQLGDTHPWTLAAAIDHAYVLAGGDDLKEATALTRSAHQDCAEFLGIDHPYTQIATSNLSLAIYPGWQTIIVDVPQT